MPTLEDARRLADDFEREYPGELPDRLIWWARAFQISRTELLRLMGLREDQILRSRKRPLKRVIELHARQAEWLNELFHQLAARSSYDWRALGRELQRTRNRPHSIQGSAHRLLARPLLYDGGDLSRLLKPSRRARTEAQLLRRIVRGGPNAIEALWSYLSRS